MAQEEFPAIAYTLLVDCRGDLYLCHALDVRCWHSGAVINGLARNASHVGIAFINDGFPTLGQLDGLAWAIVWCERQLGRELEVEGHKDAPYATRCPGDDWPGWRDTLMGYVRERRATE